MQPRRPGPSGFTLVELLVVIAIIGILVALVTVAANNAIISARITAMKLEVMNLDQALEVYKNNFGAYPPDFSDQAVLDRHIAKRFPRFGSRQNVASAPRAGSLSRAQALVFWLGPFNADPFNPFNFSPLVSPAPNPAPTMTTPLFDFKPERLVGEDQNAEYSYLEYNASGQPVLRTGKPGYEVSIYVAQYGDVGLAPLVYFDGASGLMNANLVPGGVPDTQSYYKRALFGVAVPYVEDVNKNSQYDQAADRYASPKRFQLVCAGLDGVLGVNIDEVRLFPTGVRVTKTDPTPRTDGGDVDADNIVNFSELRTLEDAKP